MRKVGSEFLGGHVIKSHRRAFFALVAKVGGDNCAFLTPLQVFLNMLQNFSERILDR